MSLIVLGNSFYPRYAQSGEIELSVKNEVDLFYNKLKTLLIRGTTQQAFKYFDELLEHAQKNSENNVLPSRCFGRNL